MRRGLLIPLVASLFTLSFIESWAALLDAARAAGIPYPQPWPWMVDGFIVATALLVVEARRAGHRAGVWWPRLGLFGATALSTGIQATWAPQADWAWALHAWSPLAVLFSFECLVWLVFGQRPAAALDLEGLEAQQAELDTMIEAERVQLEERLENARMATQVRTARHRAIALGAPVVDFGLGDWKALLEQHDHHCAYCGTEGVSLLIEHRTPLSRGGEHTKANIVPACERCNLSKSTKTEAEWQEHKEYQKAVALGQAPERPARPKTVAQPNGFSPAQLAVIDQRLTEKRSALSIKRELGLSDRAYKAKLLPYVRERVAQGPENGDRPKEPVP
jgi:hypothetical protein